MDVSIGWKKSAISVLILAALGGAAWQWRRVEALANAVSPPAAASDAVPRPAARAKSLRAEGRLAARPGALVTIGADFGGTVRTVAFEERARVKKGDLLIDIAADETRAALAEAQARVREADVEIAFFDDEAIKAERLLASSAVPQTVLDRAVHDRDAARAHKVSAQATAARLGATLAKSRVVAPFDGAILERNVEPGQLVAPGTTIAILADLSRLRVEAEVDEYDTARLAVGASVAIRAEGYSESWRGKVEEIPDSVGPRKLRPQDPGKPSDTRVVTAKIALDGATPLKLGQRVEVEIDAP
jgi:HlyD family secretion protein